MKIETGKRYWSRDGWLSPHIMPNHEEGYPFRAGESTYLSDGKFYEHGEDGNDLVAEYTGSEPVPLNGKRVVVLKEVLQRFSGYWMLGWESGQYPHEKLVSPDETIFTGNERVVEV